MTNLIEGSAKLSIHTQWKRRFAFLSLSALLFSLCFPIGEDVAAAVQNENVDATFFNYSKTLNGLDSPQVNMRSTQTSATKPE
jgi:hypothetical protein